MLAGAASVQAQSVATWDGGNGDFNAPKWNGGMTAQEVFGNTRISDGAWNVTIGDGSVVTYLAPGTGGGLRPQSVFDTVDPEKIIEGHFTIKEGAVLHHTTAQIGDADGMWTQWDVDTVLDNGTLKRDFQAGGDAQAGGIIMFGSWRSLKNQHIDVQVINGGKIQNDGQLWFGADEEHAVGLGVSVIVNNGTIDLTGGAYPTSNDTNVVSADWAIFYGRQFAEGNGTANDGSPKGEDYEVNFRGPGSITVDESGIWLYDQDEFGAWTAAKSTYEDLWNRGILKVKGMSGANNSGQLFSNFFNVTGTSGSANYKVEYKAPTVVTWDGGTGDWQTDAKWNGGQDAFTVFGTDRGFDGGYAVVIDGSKPGGAHVTYQGTSDFRPRSDNGVASITVKSGGILELHTNSADDGVWTRWMADLHIDGGEFRRTKDGVNSLTGGAFILGGYGGKPGLEIDMSITNGGEFNHDGQLWFGVVDGDSPKDLEITMTINNGTMDLTGGDSFPLLGAGFEPDLAFAYTYTNHDGDNTTPDVPADEKYAINFTGSGSITVDHSGIYTIRWDEFGVPTGDDQTYQDLWNLGILQANGLSGLDGASFGDFFTVTGTLGSDNYTLTSKLGGIAGDFDGNGLVDGADFLKWQRDLGDAANLAIWKGALPAVAAVGAVPEPAALGLACLAMGAVFAMRRRVS
jgi:hypothetical protein